MAPVLQQSSERESYDPIHRDRSYRIPLPVVVGLLAEGRITDQGSSSLLELRRPQGSAVRFARDCRRVDFLRASRAVSLQGLPGPFLCSSDSSPVGWRHELNYRPVSSCEIRRAEARCRLKPCPTGRPQVSRKPPQRFHLLRPGFLLEVLRYKVRSRAALDPGGETISSENSSAAYAAESFCSALHQRDEPVPLKDIVGRNLSRR